MLWWVLASESATTGDERQGPEQELVERQLHCLVALSYSVCDHDVACRTCDAEEHHHVAG